MPQRITDHKANVLSSIQFFCGRYNNTEIRKSNDIHSFVSVELEVGFWVQAKYGDSLSNSCPDPVKINGHECERLLSEGMAKCDPLVGDSHGYTIKGECLDYVSLFLDLLWREEPALDITKYLIREGN